MGKRMMIILLLVLLSVLLLIMNTDQTNFNFFGFSFRVVKAYVYVGFLLWGMVLGALLR